LASGAEGDSKFTRISAALAIAAAALALWSTAGALRAREEPPSRDRTVPTSVAYPVTRFDRIGGFWIGAWCAPPARTTTAEAWTRFADAGIDVGILALEDRLRRQDNLARLTLLDSLNGARIAAGLRPVYAVVRDDSLHPDETLRPGWEGRLERARVLYSKHPSCVGLFLADEPSVSSVRTLAPIARAAATRLETLPGVFVNFAGLPGHPSITDRPRWRANLERSLQATELRFFTVDSYAGEDPGGEWPNNLLALEDAARVAYDTGGQFGYLIQVTGHGHFAPATPAKARLRAFEALAYGATAIVWFTYWTPDPSEEPWRWREGLVDYATGEPTAQYAMVRDVNAEARSCAAWWGVTPTTGVAHLGGELPPGADALRARSASAVPGLERTTGGPVSIAYRAADRGRRKLLVVNRDTNRARSIELAFDAAVVRAVTATTFAVGARGAANDATPSSGLVRVRFELAPGGAIGLELALAPADSAGPHASAGRP
jgi:hypothetical protein